jgi:hypothetical protein
LDISADEVTFSEIKPEPQEKPTKENIFMVACSLKYSGFSVQITTPVKPNWTQLLFRSQALIKPTIGMNEESKRIKKRKKVRFEL